MVTVMVADPGGEMMEGGSMAVVVVFMLVSLWFVLRS